MENTPKDIELYQKNYSDDGLWEKVKAVAKAAGIKVIYLVLLLYYTLQADSTPKEKKAIILGALGYFILPLDLIPDFLPGGYADDFAALLACVKTVYVCITPAIKDLAYAKVQEWFGPTDRKSIEKLF